MKLLLVVAAVVGLAAGCSGRTPVPGAAPAQPPSPQSPASNPPKPACRNTADDADTASFLRAATPRVAKIDVHVTFEKSTTPLCSPVTVGAAWYTVTLATGGGVAYALSRLNANKGVYNGESAVVFMGHSDVCYRLLVVAYVGTEPDMAELPQLKQPISGDKKYLEVADLGGRIVAGEYYPLPSRCQ